MFECQSVYLAVCLLVYFKPGLKNDVALSDN